MAAPPVVCWLGRGTVGQILPFVPRVVFDDADTCIMGEAFDAACEEVRDDGQPPLAREAMAKRIIDAARAGERDVNRLREAALSGLKCSRLPNLKLRHAEVPGRAIRRSVGRTRRPLHAPRRMQIERSSAFSLSCSQSLRKWGECQDKRDAHTLRSNPAPQPHSRCVAKGGAPKRRNFR